MFLFRLCTLLLFPNGLMSTSMLRYQAIFCNCPKMSAAKGMNTSHNSTHGSGMNSTYRKGIYTASGVERAVTTNLTSTILELCLTALPPVEV